MEQDWKQVVDASVGVAYHTVCVVDVPLVLKKLWVVFFDPKKIEKIIDAIKSVLENSNISKLRSKYPELSGNSEADIVMTADRPDQVVIIINGLEIDPYERD